MTIDTSGSVPFPDGIIPLERLHYDAALGLHMRTDCQKVHGERDAAAAAVEEAYLNLPIDGSRLRVAVSIDGQNVVDADLTTLYLRSKFAGDDIIPLWFVPYVPKDEDDDEEQPKPRPVHAVLRLTIAPTESAAAFSWQAPAEPAPEHPRAVARIHDAPYGDEIARRSDDRWGAVGL